MNRLQNKVVVVTGGSGLLGEEIIRVLRAEGAIAINADVALQTSEDTTTVQCDITSEDSVKSALGAILAGHGRIDGLVNNAYPRTKDWGVKFEDIPLVSWQQNVDMQLNSYFYLCQQVLQTMTGQGSGSIVNIASIYGMVGPDFSVYGETNMTMPAAYSAIKGGLISLTRYLAAYFGPNGVRVNCVSPGGVFNHQPEDFVRRYSQKVPLRRMAAPADVSPAVAFLLSDEAGYITGQNLAVDGGWTAI